MGAQSQQPVRYLLMKKEYRVPRQRSPQKTTRQPISSQQKAIDEAVALHSEYKARKKQRPSDNAKKGTKA